jgi:hypothetical protein
MPDGPCLAGTSDDGIGTYALGYFSGDSPPSPVYNFFELQSGRAVRVGDVTAGNDEVSVNVYSQPSGFTAIKSAPVPDVWAELFTHDGARTRTIQISRFNQATQSWNEGDAGIDPAGGIAAVESQKGTDGKWQMTYTRYDKAGNVEIPGVAVDDAAYRMAKTVGVDLNGNVLILAFDISGGVHARWLKRDGTPLTAWFFTSNDWYFDLLAGGGLVARAGRTQPATAVYASGQAGPQDLPAWLQARAQNGLALVRDGKAYASWGTQGACAGGVEILSSATGKSCGCVAGLSGVIREASVGRDGSLIVPSSSTGYARACSYALYPQLLK